MGRRPPKKGDPRHGPEGPDDWDLEIDAALESLHPPEASGGSLEAYVEALPDSLAPEGDTIIGGSADAGEEDSLGDGGMRWTCSGCYRIATSEEQPVGWKLMPVTRPDGQSVWHALCETCRGRVVIEYPAAGVDPKWRSWEPIKPASEAPLHSGTPPRPMSGPHLRPPPQPSGAAPARGRSIPYRPPAAPSGPVPARAAQPPAAPTTPPVSRPSMDPPTTLWNREEWRRSEASGEPSLPPGHAPRCECGAIATRRAVVMFERRGQLVQSHVSPRCPSCSHVPEVSVPTGVTIHFTMEPLPSDQAAAARRELEAAYRALSSVLDEDDEPSTDSGRR